MSKMLSAFVRNTVFANLLLAMILVAGFASISLMVRELLPSFEVESIQVRVPYPGAGPEEVEEGIILKIEDAIEGVQGVKKYTTMASEGMGSAVIDVDFGEDVQVVKDRITDRINAITTFPDDSENPSVSEILIRRNTLAISVAGDIPERQLKELTEDIKDELIQLPEVSDVQISGLRDYEISIEISEKDLRRYGLTFDDVSRVIRNSGLNVPGGQLRGEAEEITIRTMGRKYTGKEFEEIVLLSQPGGTSLRVRDIATVRDTFVEDTVITRYNGMPAMTLMISNADDEDAMNIASAVKEYVNGKNAKLESLGLTDTVKLYTWLDASRFIVERIDLLLRNGIIGLALVFMMLWIFLDFRLAFWVAMGIPISLAGGLFLMYLSGQSINMISLFAMIMVLGIVVDDAIVVGESIYVHRKMGKGPIMAAVDGTLEVAMPVLAAVLTSIVAFFPLLFIEGIMGNFISVIPIVVISALLVSLVEGLIILPAHLNHLPDLNKPLKTHNPLRIGFAKMHKVFNGGLERFVQKMYQPALREALSWRYVSLSVILGTLLVTAGFVGGGMVKFIFFPQIDTSFIWSSVEFPEGTPAEVTADAVQRLENSLFELAEDTDTISGESFIVASLSNVGTTMMSMDGSVSGAAVNRGEVLVELTDSEDRGIHYREIIQQWRENVGPIAGITSLTFDADSGGPPGKPIELWLLGQDLDQLVGAADLLVEHLNEYAGVFQVEHDFRPGKRELRARLRPEARNLGLTTADLARQLRQGFYGDELMRVQRGRDELKVWVRYPQDERRSLADVENIRIRTAAGAEIPLDSVADVTIEEGYTTITRKDGLRRVAVTADVFTNITNPAEVLASLEEKHFPEVREAFPGVTISTEGEKAETQESLSSLKVGFPLAVLAIYLIVATLFRSYVQPIVIMVTVPFGIIGAVWGHMALGFDLTIMSFFGMVALTGVVVNDAIILIEAVNDRLAAGYSFADAIVEGGGRRFRAILLTTVTTVGGLTPLIMETSMQAQFLIPMAITIAAGVAFASVLTLFLIPCLLFILNDLRRFFAYVQTGVKPTREEVEPATRRKLSDEEFFGPATPPPVTTGGPAPEPAG